MFENALDIIIYLVFFVSPVMSLIYLLRSLRAREFDRLRWQVAHVFAMFAWVGGTVMTFLFSTGIGNWGGLTLSLVGISVMLWAIISEQKTTRDKEL